MVVLLESLGSVAYVQTGTGAIITPSLRGEIGKVPWNR